MSPVRHNTWKAVNRSVEFKGLSGPYLIIAAAGFVTILLMLAVLHFIGCPIYGCVAVAVLGGAALLIAVYWLNRRYGRNGFRKKRTAAAFPRRIKTRSRQLYFIETTKKMNQ